jgi:hypothetical protein
VSETQHPRCEWCERPCAKGRRFCSRSHAKKWEWEHNREKRLKAVRAANAARAKYPGEERSCLVCRKSLGRIRGSRIKNGRGRFCGEHRYLWGQYKKLHRERKGKIVACPVPGCDVTRYLEPGELLRENFTGLCRSHNGLTEKALRDLEEGRKEIVRHERELRIKLQEMDKVDPQTAAVATNVTPGNFHAALRHERAGDQENGRPPVEAVTVENQGPYAPFGCRTRGSTRGTSCRASISATSLTASRSRCTSWARGGAT